MKRTYIPTFVDDTLEPEEILIHSPATQRLERSITRWGIWLVVLCILGVLGIFVLRLGYLQIIKGGHFRALALENQFLRHTIYAPRGFIFDSAGRLLAGSEQYFELLVLPREVDLDRIADYSELLTRVTDLRGEQVQDALNEKIAGPLTIFYTSDTKIKSEIERAALPGLFWVDNYRRQYPTGETAVHITGYVSEVSGEELQADSTYQLGDVVGRGGLESFYEDYLRGKNGAVLFYKGRSGSPDIKVPVEGAHLITTLDFDLQEILVQEMRSALKELGLRRAAAVVQNPKTGSILALASFPEFDPNAFSARNNSVYVNKVLNDGDKPLFNRVITGLFPPGSTIKPLIALAALEEKIISPARKLLTEGAIIIANQYNPDIIYTFRDWKNHGLTDMIKAIADSVDVYFYAIGGGYFDIPGLGINRIAKYFKLFNIDRELEVDLSGETSGFVPTPQWKKINHGQTWFTGDTYNISIGQGDLLVTPLWLNSYTGALTQYGKMYQPFLVKRIVTPLGDVLYEKQPKILNEIAIQPQNFNTVLAGMRSAVADGTVWRLKDFPVAVGGKTGSAEVIKGASTNAWLTAFAPYDHPEITITVLIEHGGHGENFPARIVKRVFQRYFFKE